MSSVTGFLSRFGGGDDEASADSNPLSASAPNALGSFLNTFTTLTDSYWFYNHTIELRFDKEAHKYFKVDPELGNLTPVLGVTNTCHIIDKSMALVPWAAKKTAEKLLRTIPIVTEQEGGLPILYVPKMRLEDFTELVMKAKNAHKEILEDAGDIGHAAHKCLEDSIQHAIDHTQGIVRELINLPEDEKARNAANAAFAWMQLHNVRWIKTEQKIYSKEHDFAGTMDGLALCDSCSDPSCCAKPFKDHRSLIDWKSSNYLYIEYLLQTACYQAAEVEEYGVEIDDRWILRLGKNEEEAGKFEPWYLPADTFAEDFSGFLACLNLTRLVQSVTERMAAQKRGVRAAKKIIKAELKEIAKMKEKVDKAEKKAQKKLDREAERERIKADAKKVREDAKAAKEAAKVMAKALPLITRMVSDLKLAAEETNGSMERAEPDNTGPKQTEDTQSPTVAAEVIAEVAPVVTQAVQELPVHESVRDVPQAGSSFSLYEEVVVRKPLVIPEEG